jgi:hypothetical protein
MIHDVDQLDGAQYQQMQIKAKEIAHGVDGLAGVSRHWFQRWGWPLHRHGSRQGGLQSA